MYTLGSSERGRLERIRIRLQKGTTAGKKKAGRDELSEGHSRMADIPLDVDDRVCLMESQFYVRSNTAIVCQWLYLYRNLLPRAAPMQLEQTLKY